MKTINIKGKEYAPVNERILEFHKLHENGKIETEILSDQNNVVTMKAKVVPDVANSERYFTGHASEWQEDSKSMVNKTSHIENCETSAIGRALGSLGIGIESGFASKDEIDIVEKKQELNKLYKCESCDSPISYNVAKFSKGKYNKHLCMNCQNEQDVQEVFE